MPDQNTSWTIAFTIAVFLLSGLAFWSYYHRRSYSSVAFLIGSIGALAFAIQTASNQTLERFAIVVYPLLRPGNQEKFQAIINDLSWTYPYSYLTGLIAFGALALSYVPHKDDD